jgi:serine/threonine protein phosphatase 1
MKKLFRRLLRGPKVVPSNSPPRRRVDLGDHPPTYSLYAIGDVHGCIDQLRDAEEKIARDIAETGKPGLTILLGDYVNRGPQPAQVIEHLVKPSALGLRRISLCGNHDDLFIKFIRNPDAHLDWLDMGGHRTLLSYGIDLHQIGIKRRGNNDVLKGLMARHIPADHQQFLADLPISVRIGQLFFVHAGIRPGIPLGSQTDRDMLWIREPFLSKGAGIPSVFVIHGHTPNPAPSTGPQRMGIDTGVFYSGKLAVLKIDGGRSRFL